jgi:protein-disulfide isomerase
VAKPDKKTSGPAAPAADTTGEAKTSRSWMAIAAAVVAAVVIGGIVYYQNSGSKLPKTAEPDVSELMAPGPLEDIVLGKADAPNTIVEYASMTCPHCAQFQTVVFPELKKKYIDTGQAKYILREFPLDGLAVAAFMLARCAGPDRYYPMVDGLFESQKIWAVPGAEGKDKLLAIARQAGFSKEKFDQCISDKELFDKVVAVRTRANDKFGVDSTPTFFVNGKKLQGEHELKDFDAALAGKPAGETPPPSG